MLLLIGNAGEFPKDLCGMRTDLPAVPICLVFQVVPTVEVAASAPSSAAGL